MQKEDSFNLQEIKELAALMKPNDLTEIKTVHGDKSILLKRATKQTILTTAPAPQPTVEQPIENTDQDEKITTIKATTPGTFYAAPDKDSDPYVKIGSEVTPKTTVCIIEAMKVMNIVEAETTGTIIEVLVESGQAVEFGQELFRIKP